MQNNYVTIINHPLLYQVVISNLFFYFIIHLKMYVFIYFYFILVQIYL